MKEEEERAEVVIGDVKEVEEEDKVGPVVKGDGEVQEEVLKGEEG